MADNITKTVKIPCIRIQNIYTQQIFINVLF